MLRAEVSASTFSFFAGVVTGHENLSTPNFSRVQILTRCLRWSSITFDIEGVGKVTLALLSSPSFPFGGKRGSREKMMCTKIPKQISPSVRLLHLTRGLRIISSFDDTRPAKNDVQKIPKQRAIWSGTGQFGQHSSVADFPFFDILNRLHRQFWR